LKKKQSKSKEKLSENRLFKSPSSSKVSKEFTPIAPPQTLSSVNQLSSA